MWHVYLLECRSRRLYCGIAVDVQARFETHRAGRGARFTRAHPPERIVATFPCAGRSEALRLEYAIKQLPAARKRALHSQDGATLLARLAPAARLQQDAPDMA